MTTAPAAFVLGVASEQVPRFTTFREFAIGIGRGIDNQGKFSNNVSGEIAPALALHVLTLEDQKNWYLRALARTTISLVSVMGGDNPNAKTAYGIQSVLYSREMDEAIAKASSGECRSAAQDFLDKSTAVGSRSNTEPGMSPELDQAAKDKISSCQAAIDRIVNRWNQSMIAIGFGQAFSSVDDKAAKLRKANQVGWLTGSIGFLSNNKSNDDMGGLLTLHARIERDDVIDSPSDPSVKLLEDVRLFGANFRFGKARFHGLLEFSDRQSKVDSLGTERRKRTIIGAEYRIREGLYLSFAVGSERGRRDGNDTNLALANLKWGFSDKALFGK